jgi:hypothetical protein
MPPNGKIIHGKYKLGKKKKKLTPRNLTILSTFWQLWDEKNKPGRF